MKNLRLLFAALMLVCITATTYAQTPRAIKYQAIARSSNGEAIASQNVSFRISILKGSADGTPVYQETQTATTNQFGLANLSIGVGAVVTGLFDSIKWGNGTYFAKIEFDPKGGNEFAFMGTSQLLSVPYSLYAEHAKVADNLPSFPIKAGLRATNLQAPFDAPETGMLVYNTDSAGTEPYNVVPGYYYNAGTGTDPKWVLLSTITSDNSGSTHAGHAPCGTNTSYGGYTGGVTPAGCVMANLGSDNTAFGRDALVSATLSGTDNTGVGYEALNSNTSAYYNTVVGSLAMSNNTVTGNGNVAVGYQAAYRNSSGYANVAIGYQALYTNSTGYGNVAIGNDAVEVATANDNVGVGSASLEYTTTGTFNNGLGDNSLQNNTSGSDNVGVGHGAMEYNQTGYNNTAVGFNSLYGNSFSTPSTGSSNTGVGAYAMNSIIGGSWNTATGDSALATNTSGIDNVANGYQALATNSSGSYNTSIG
ncbi:MAG TPA: hypothetical protein VN922_22825, partial [Bacteroidia bacterium]|nr:hypothetical protein [Bacteroidia bacterium]